MTMYRLFLIAPVASGAGNGHPLPPVPDGSHETGGSSGAAPATAAWQLRAAGYAATAKPARRRVPGPAAEPWPGIDRDTRLLRLGGGTR